MYLKELVSTTREELWKVMHTLQGYIYKIEVVVKIVSPHYKANGTVYTSWFGMQPRESGTFKIALTDNYQLNIVDIFVQVPFHSLEVLHPSDWFDTVRELKVDELQDKYENTSKEAKEEFEELFAEMEAGKEGKEE